MNKTKYMQTDSRWGGLGYPKKPWYLRNCGCGEVSIANVIIEMDDYKCYTPATIQPWCKQFAAPNGNGTYFSGIPKMMSHYGLTEVKEHATMSTLWTELAKGDRVGIYLMGKRKGGSKGVHWSSGGHFVCSVGYKYENGKHFVYVKDSYSNSSLRNGWLSYEEAMKGDVLRVWSGKLKTVSATDYRPTTPYTGTLPTKTVKDGTKGEDTKACQTFLNWCINAGLKVDGSAGAKTVKAIKVFQKTYGLGVDGSFGKKSREKAQEIIKAHEEHPYDGEYPNPIVTVTVERPNTEKVVDMAKKLAWPVDTEPGKYAYKGGSATAAFKAALDKVFPKHNKWGKAASKGASCDVFAATVMNSTGIVTNMPRGYDEQKKYTNANLSKITRNDVKPLSVGKAGDMILYTKNSSGSSHHVIILGNGVIYEAQYEKTYGHVNTSTSKINTSRPKVIIFRAKGTYKTTTTRSYLMRGDKGEEVKKLQRYINWFFYPKYGKDVLTVDGSYGAKTEAYCKLMQSDLGFKDADGYVGPKTVEAMKGWKQ